MWLTLILVILLAPVVLLTATLLFNRVPLIDPPGLAARLKTYFGNNVAELQADAGFPELRPVIYPVKPALLCRQIPAALDTLRWQWRAMDDCRYQAVVTTPLLGFKDDVSIAVEALGDSSSRLKVRSASRVGRGDMGANLRHVLDLVHAIEQQ